MFILKLLLVAVVGFAVVLGMFYLLLLSMFKMFDENNDTTPHKTNKQLVKEIQRDI